MTIYVIEEKLKGMWNPLSFSGGLGFTNAGMDCNIISCMDRDKERIQNNLEIMQKRFPEKKFRIKEYVRRENT